MLKRLLSCVVLFAPAVAAADDTTTERIISALERLEARISRLESRYDSGSSYQPLAYQPRYSPPVMRTSYSRPRSEPVDLDSDGGCSGGSSGSIYYPSDTSSAAGYGVFRYQNYVVRFVIVEQ